MFIIQNMTLQICNVLTVEKHSFAYNFVQHHNTSILGQHEVGN